MDFAEYTPLPFILLQSFMTSWFGIDLSGEFVKNIHGSSGPDSLRQNCGENIIGFVDPEFQ